MCYYRFLTRMEVGAVLEECAGEGSDSVGCDPKTSNAYDYFIVHDNVLRGDTI
jgi:hypothetical protein